MLTACRYVSQESSNRGLSMTHPSIRYFEILRPSGARAKFEEQSLRLVPADMLVFFQRSSSSVRDETARGSYQLPPPLVWAVYVGNRYVWLGLRCKQSCLAVQLLHFWSFNLLSTSNTPVSLRAYVCWSYSKRTSLLFLPC